MEQPLSPYPTIAVSQSSASVGWATNSHAPDGNWVLFSVFNSAGDQIALIEATADSIGLSQERTASSQTARDDGYGLPPHVAAALKSITAPSEGERAIAWLVFRQPVGYLPTIPWERLLFEECGIAVIRIGTDAIAIEPRGSIDVALCFSCPLYPGSEWTTEKVVDLFLSMLPKGESKTRLHIFADKDARPIFERKRSMFQSAEVIIHTPRPDAAYLDVSKSTPSSSRRAPKTPMGQALVQVSHAAGRAGRALTRSWVPPIPLENPWLVWMRDELEDITIEYAHFVCHGHLGSEFGSLLFANPFVTDDQRWARYVSARELRDFLTWIGAWSFGVSAPPTNPSPGGLRYLLHELANLRAGPVLMHEMRYDTGTGALERGYRVFSSRDPYIGSGAVSVWWHPARLLRDEMLASEVTLARHLESARDSEGELPAWVVKAQRSLENTAAGLRQEPRSDLEQALLSGMQSALSTTVGLLAEFMEKEQRKPKQP